MSVLRDLVIDMAQFYTQYKKFKPYLIGENKQSLNSDKIIQIYLDMRLTFA